MESHRARFDAKGIAVNATAVYDATSTRQTPFIINDGIVVCVTRSRRSEIDDEKGRPILEWSQLANFHPLLSQTQQSVLSTVQYP